jgi:hypothetical protein
VLKIIIPQEVEPGNVQWERAYLANTPANKEMVVEAVAIYRVFQAQRVKMVCLNSSHWCARVEYRTKNNTCRALYSSKT